MEGVPLDNTFMLSQIVEQGYDLVFIEKQASWTDIYDSYVMLTELWTTTTWMPCRIISWDSDKVFLIELEADKSWYRESIENILFSVHENY